MTGKIGEVIENELWLRCPECGDSPNDPEKCHFSINLQKFVYHCYRCGAGGALSTKQIFALATQSLYDLDVRGIIHSQQLNKDSDPDVVDLIPGPGNDRPTRLPRNHYISPSRQQTIWDAFEMRHAKDNTRTGIHLRASGHQHLNIGERGYGWSSPTSLTSREDDPIRLVEGPYDVVKARDVCVFGTISRKSLKDLSGHYVVLCPDGDIWADKQLLKQFLNCVQWLLNNNRLIYLVAIEYITDPTKDPDDFPETVLIPRREIHQFVRNMIGGLI